MTKSTRSAPPGAILLAASAMGTRFELVLPDEGSRESHRRAAGAAVLAEIVELDQRLSLFRKDSLLAHINREARNGWVRLDDDMFTLIELCTRTWRDSDGAFDVTVAPLMRAWGLHTDSVLPSTEAAPICGPEGCVIPGAVPTEGTPPPTAPSPSSASPSASTRSGGRPDSGAIELDSGAMSIRFRAPITLDFGGVAKGFALDIALRTLRDAGIAHAFLQGGTSAIAALGSSRPAAQGTDNRDHPWRVGITVPERAAANGTVMIALRDMALCVSAHHGRMADGRGHIIDPTTNAPARDVNDTPATGVAEVAAVIADLTTDPTAWPCTYADAWTKPVLLNRTRPSRMPMGLTSIVATTSTVEIAGPHVAHVAHPPRFSLSPRDESD